jgi:hypothetical protein
MRSPCPDCGADITQEVDSDRTHIAWVCTKCEWADSDPDHFEMYLPGHPTHVRGFESIQDAAEWIENMRYDGLRDFFGHLHNAVRGRATKDRFEGRVVLAHRLERLADFMGMAEVELKFIWELCEKHMKPEGSGK